MLWTCGGIYAQNTTALKDVNNFRILENHIFAKSNSSTELDNRYLLNTLLVQHLVDKRPNVIDKSIYYRGKCISFAMYRSEIFTSNFQMYGDDGNELQFESIFYRGNVKNDENSIVTLSIVKGDVSLWVVTDSYQFEINKIEGVYLLEVNTDEYPDISCHTPEEDKYEEVRASGSHRSQGNCLDIYLEVDYDIYLAHNSDVSSLAAWTFAIFNNVATLYENEDVPIYLSGIFYHTSPDTYGSDLVSVLNEFVSVNSAGFNGKLAFLMSGKSLGGGISQGIGGFCNAPTAYPGPFAIAGDMTVPTSNYPTYSYNVMIMAHELGHVMGLRHTHACVWNGNNTQIDDCGNVYAMDNGNTPEGINCFDSSSPIIPATDGTIMSNCNLLNNSAINFAAGFGVEPGDLLYDNFIYAPCSLGDNCRGVLPINDLCAGAIPITLSNTCTVKVYDNNLATSSGATPGFTCGNSGSTVDVWFSIVIPSSGSVTLETSNVTNGLTDMVMQLYSGTCGNLTQIDCDDNSGVGNQALIQLNNRTPDEVIFVRIIESGSNLEGDFGFCAYDTSIPCHPDFDALNQFYIDMAGSMWNNNTGWIDGQAGLDCNVCNWQGVVCNAFGRVREINLPNNNLTGPLPISLRDLNYLDKFNFYANSIVGSIPAFLKDIILLEYVDLGSNMISGSLPISLGDCANLRTLYLDNNTLSGTIPSNLVNAPINTCWLNSNNLSGCIPNTFFEFCLRNAVINLNNNPMLPYTGNYTLLCTDSLGADIDLDGYCGGTEDCIDTDPNSYPGAVEVCDGLDNDCDTIVDDGNLATANTWLSSSSDWNDVNNWSTSIVPKACHDVYIYPSMSDSIIIYANTDAKARTLVVGPNALLHIQNFSSLSLIDVAGVVNQGIISLYGNLDVIDPLFGNGINFYNEGMLDIYNSGNLNLQGNVNGLFNTSMGEISNLGSIDISNILSGNGVALDNYGVINNSGLIKTTNVLGFGAIVRSGSLLTNSSVGLLDF